MPTTDDIVRELMDREQLKELRAKYFRCLDLRDHEGFRSVFTEDAVLEVPEVDLILRGHEEIADKVLASLTGAVSAHHGHTHELAITGPDTATGIWAMQDIVEWPPTASGERIGITGVGHYHDEYLKQDGQWRIAKVRLVRIRVQSLSDL
ncbi:rieske [2Fe-2S] domain-containing protein [Mycolicibacterium aurum]|uniref:Rieske [2Fe-2S] domain-containing protein n=1 Tax=Mycolicibacterium aurum TaxID=1791 RepID=A0A3S4RXF9_MYCAU|nr:nuclear transport factor 2 family protein [Mycolicibacterium aurum]VEG57614.1 rieske [2Fe-2S] domain-containing protein [Mycolicibacterium aurum]